MKCIQDSATEQVHLVRYPHLNGQRRLFGGMLMQWIDEVAGMVALRHTGSEVITASVDSLNFKAPAFLNDFVVLKGRISYVGKTSIEVSVDTFVECPKGERKLINQAFLVLVSLDTEGTPQEVPPVMLQTDEEKNTWDAGQKRYELRKRRKAEHF